MAKMTKMVKNDKNNQIGQKCSKMAKMPKLVKNGKNDQIGQKRLK